MFVCVWLDGSRTMISGVEGIIYRVWVWVWVRVRVGVGDVATEARSRLYGYRKPGVRSIGRSPPRETKKKIPEKCRKKKNTERRHGI